MAVKKYKLIKTSCTTILFDSVILLGVYEYGQTRVLKKCPWMEHLVLEEETLLKVSLVYASGYVKMTQLAVQIFFAKACTEWGEHKLAIMC